MNPITVGDLIAQAQVLCDDVHDNGSAYPVLVRSASGPTVVLCPLSVLDGESMILSESIGTFRLPAGAEQLNFDDDFNPD